MPPKGIFDWHYLQCVIPMFAAQDYRSFLNIRFFAHPFKTADDSDDEWDDEDFDNGEADPPYPSYPFDRFLVKQGEKLKEIERNKTVARWISSIQGVSAVEESVE